MAQIATSAFRFDVFFIVVSLAFSKTVLTAAKCVVIDVES